MEIINKLPNEMADCIYEYTNEYHIYKTEQHIKILLDIIHKYDNKQKLLQDNGMMSIDLFNHTLKLANKIVRMYVNMNTNMNIRLSTVYYGNTFNLTCPWCRRISTCCYTEFKDMDLNNYVCHAKNHDCIRNKYLSYNSSYICTVGYIIRSIKHRDHKIYKKLSKC